VLPCTQYEEHLVKCRLHRVLPDEYNVHYNVHKNNIIHVK
jgi:hypothetical protein